EGVDAHSGQGRREYLLEVLYRELRDGLTAAGKHSLEEFDMSELRLRLHDHGKPLEAVDYLSVHRMLDPGVAILVESRNGLLRGHKRRARAVRCRTDKVDDGLPCRAVIPGR